MSKKPEILNTTVVAQSRLFDVENVHLRFSNGAERHFERVGGRGYGSVLVVPQLDHNTILLVREYSVGVEDYVLAFPKGAIEKAEDVLVTAGRELKEEVGYGARNFLWLAQLSAAPSYMRSMMQIVLATDLYVDAAVGDEPEPFEVVPWRLDQLDALLAHPEFHEARSVAALFLVARLQHAR